MERLNFAGERGNSRQEVTSRARTVEIFGGKVWRKLEHGEYRCTRVPSIGDGGFDRFSSRFTIYTFSNKSRNVGTDIFVDSNWI